MYAYEIQYRENGILKAKGFKYREQFDRFIARMNRKSNVEIIRKFINVAE